MARAWEIDLRAALMALLAHDAATREAVEDIARKVARQEVALRAPPEKVTGALAAQRLAVPLRTFWRHVGKHAAAFDACRHGSRFLWPEIEDVYRRLYG